MSSHDFNSDVETSSGLHSSSAAQASASAAQAALLDADTPRASLLDVVLAEYNLERSSRTSRVVIVGELDAEKIPLLQKFHADFLDSLDPRADEDQRMTGVCFVVNGTTSVQLIEAPTKIIVQFLRNMAHVSGMGNGGTKAAPTPSSASSSTPSFVSVDPRYQPLFRAASLLTFVEEVPREFVVWAFRSLRLAAEDVSSDLSSSASGSVLLKHCWDSVRNLLELARELSQLSEEKAIDFVQTSASKQLQARIPSSERLHAFLHAADELCSVTDWLEIYDSPIEFTLENERVWPVEPFLKVRRAAQQQAASACGQQ